MNSNKLLGVMFVAVILFAGCKKDKDTNQNFINYDGTKYALAKGILENLGQWSVGGDNNLYLTLLSGELTVIESQGGVDGISGTGHGIQLWMYSTSSTSLVNDIYVYDADASEMSGTFEWANVRINFNFTAGSGEIDELIASGNVTVSKSGDVYEITLDLMDEAGKTVTGYYKGTLKYYDYDSKKSTHTKTKRF